MLVSLVRLCLASLLPLTAGAGCAAAGPAKSVDAEQRGRLTVVAAFYPLQFVAQRVAGDHAEVTSLTQPGAEPHDLELTPRQVANLTTASVVIYQKGFQPAVDEAVVQSGNSELIDTSTVVPLRPLSTIEDDHDHGPGAGPDGPEMDPHVWLDPMSVSMVARTVQERLTTLDPDHAAEYSRNTDALHKQLVSLDRSFRAGLRHCIRTEFMTTHAAFGYLAARYHLTQIAISGLSPDSEPSPARIAEVQREARDHQLSTIFYETLVSPAVAQAIADDLGLATDVLDPVEGITSQSRGQDYLSVMYANLSALRKAGSCS
ncbi:MAG TPA: metal ABC transporter substrate-binding protein [Propionibacteriaceae bacterium]|nr:metal ABC transporter substrate-binding protein [Propionibacteriaceae bacterium]